MPGPGQRRTAFITLIALGALVSLVAHQLAYLAARPLLALRPALDLAPSGSLDHPHLSTQFALVTPLAAVAAAVVIVRWARRLGLGTELRAGQLGAAGALLFVGQEAIEAVTQTGGIGAMTASPATFLGLLLAPVIAAVAVRLLRQASAIVARLLDTHSPEFPDVPLVPRPVDGVDRGRIRTGANPARGPPRLVHLTTT